MFRVGSVKHAARTLVSIVSIAATGLLLLSSRVARADPSSTTIDQGYGTGEVPHPRSVAMGNAQEAWGGSTSALYVNPANLTAYRVYHLEAIAAFDPQARRQTYGGAIADSSTSKLAGGFAGTWSRMDPDGIDRAWTDLRLGLAYPFGEHVSFGVTGRYLRVNQAIAAGPLGASRASDGTPGEPFFNQFTFDAGMGIQVNDQVRIGLTGKNLTATGSAIAPIITAGGVGWSNQTVTVEADAAVDYNTYGSARFAAMAGGEYLAADRFPLRIGYRYDDGQKVHRVGIGGGYVEKKFSLELGVGQDIADRPATTISVGLRIFIDSAQTSGNDTSQDQ